MGGHPKETNDPVSRLTKKPRKAVLGSSTVELALILPLLLGVVFASINFGVALYNQAVITNASREAARVGVAFRVPAATNQEIQAVAQSYCADNLVTFGDKVDPVVNVTSTFSRLPGDPLTVTINYGYKGVAFLKFGSPATLSARTTMTFE